jgi:hypothetical protein
VLFPYLNGRDLNTHHEQAPSRWVINFFGWPLQKAEQYSACFRIVSERVKPERTAKSDPRLREFWWLHERPRLDLYRAIADLPRVLVCSNVMKHFAFALVPATYILNENLCIFANRTHAYFCLMQNSLHEAWARQYSSTLKSDLKYSLDDAYISLPFPSPERAEPTCLESLGETYHEHRRQIMLARQEGLTATYNRFHNPDERAADIARLRELHAEMDRAVAAAYGWSDLDLGHGFHETAQGVRYTISEAARREVLGRLLELNHQRYAEEVAAGGQETKGKVKAQVKAKVKAEDEAPKAKRGKAATDAGGALKLF